MIRNTNHIGVRPLVFDAGQGRRVIVDTQGHFEADIRIENVTARERPGFFSRFYRSFSTQGHMADTHASDNESLGGFVESLVKIGPVNAAKVRVISSRHTDRPWGFLTNTFQGEFFDIKELKQDICNFLKRNPDTAARHNIIFQRGRVNPKNIPRDFYAASPNNETNPGVSAAQIFNSLRISKRQGGVGPSDSLNRYMLCQLLSIREINSQFTENHPLDLDESTLYEQATGIAEELTGFIANNDTKDSMMSYLKTPSVAVPLGEREINMPPIVVLQALKRKILSTSGTGSRILDMLEKIQQRNTQLNPQQREERLAQSLSIVSHGPEGGDAQGVLIALGSPIPFDKMALAAALVFDVTRTFPNPHYGDTELSTISMAEKAFSNRAAIFRKNGHSQFSMEDNRRGKDFLVAHGLINSEGEVIGPNGPVHGHCDTVYFTNSREDNLEHMLKKAMLVNGIMALGKENIINKTSASDQLSSALVVDLNAHLGRMPEF